MEKETPFVPSICVDELRFTQVIVGLIARAVRFTRKGEKVFFSMSVHIENGQQFLKISIRDQGIGLDEEELQMIANKYDTLRISRRTDGTDLELAAIEKLVQMHQGRCMITQQWKVGTTITVLFPYRSKEECQQLNQNIDATKKAFVSLCDWNP